MSTTLVEQTSEPDPIVEAITALTAVVRGCRPLEGNDGRQFHPSAPKVLR